jgi:hypothetical protein
LEAVDRVFLDDVDRDHWSSRSGLRSDDAQCLAGQRERRQPQFELTLSAEPASCPSSPMRCFHILSHDVLQ